MQPEQAHVGEQRERHRQEAIQKNRPRGAKRRHQPLQPAEALAEHPLRDRLSDLGACLANQMVVARAEPQDRKIRCAG